MRRLLAVILCVVLSFAARGQAYDFWTVCSSGQTLYYKITNASRHEVAVVNPTGNRGSQTWAGYTSPSGNLTIPGTTSYNGQTYNVTSVAAYAFGHCNYLWSVDIGSGISRIGTGAFYNCATISSLTLPATLTVVDTQAFSNCQSLTSLTLPTSLIRINYSAFSSCSGLIGTLTIPNQVTYIGDFAFGNCNRLTTLVVGSSVTAIGARAFAMCFRLGLIDMLPVVPPQIDSTTFSHHTQGVQPVSRATQVHVPCGSLPAYLVAPHWNYFTNIYQDPWCPQITRFDTAICANRLPLTWRGYYFTVQGSHIDTLRAANGLDSLIIYTLRVNDTSVNRVQASTCDFFTWHNQTYRASGAYTYHMANSNRYRCDSLDVLDLTIRFSTSGDTVVNACDSFLWHGRTYRSTTSIGEGEVDGAFSVSGTLRVAFATGNLQYRASDGVWRLAPEQYTAQGIANRRIGPNSTDWIDLFGWGTSGWNNGNVYYQPHSYALNGNPARGYGYGPVNGTNYANDLCGPYAEADWCVHNPIVGAGNEAGLWRTLTSAEWQYVANGRRNAGQLRALVTIRESGTDLGQGLLLLPDGWQPPAGVSFSAGRQNTYNLAQWRTMERSGAVMLPITGYRMGQTYISANGQYWSSTHDNDIGVARCQMFTMSSATLNITTGFARYYGGAVRPVHDLPTYAMSGGNAAGCDSVVTLHLTIYHGSTGDSVAEVCDSMRWHGNRLTAAGRYSSDSLARPFVLRDGHGCDSTVKLRLRVNRSSRSRHSDTIVLSQLPWSYYGFSVAGASFAAGHQSWDTAAMVHTTNVYGCDSLIDYHLYVRRDVVDTIDSTVCENALPLRWNGILFQVTGVSGDTVLCHNVRYTGGGSHGEDSLLTMRLHVLPGSASVYYDTVVENNLPRVFLGSAFMADTSRRFIILNWRGCDSVIDYHLHVWRNVYDTVDSTVCQTALPLRWNSRLFDTVGMGAAPGGVYTIELTSLLRAATGADSVLTMRLHVHRTSHTVRRDTIVERQLPYTVMGQRFTRFAADTLFMLHDAAGCDSIVEFHLVVHRNVSSRADSVVCESDLPLRWNSRLFDTVGLWRISGIWNVQMTDTLTASTGADSILTMRLHVLRNSRGDWYDTTVQNAMPHVFLGVRFYEAQADTVFRLVNATGCDSLLHYHLYVHHNVGTIVDSSVCYSVLPLAWGHCFFAPPQAGQGLLTQNDTLLSAGGADSVVIRRLHVYAVYDQHLYDTICSDSVLLFMGFGYRQQGVYPHTLHSVAGCDSVVTLHLTVHAVTQSAYYDTVTENSMPHTFLGVTITAMGADTTLHTVNRHGCDSVVHYHLFVHRNVYDTADSAVCESQLPLLWNGLWFRQAAAGAGSTIQQNAVLRAASGADSLLTMRLHLLYASRRDYYDTVVQNALPVRFMGCLTSGDTTLHTLNVAGCDSAVHYHLHVWRNIVDTADTAVCPSALPLRWNGVTFHGDSVAARLIARGGRHGEDSTVVMHLRVLANTASAVTDTVVENSLPWRYRDSLFRGPIAGHRFVTTNAAGCDSVITYSIYVHWNRYSYVDSTICDTLGGRSLLPLVWGLHTYSGAGQYTDTLHTVGGADSVVRYTLHVLHSSRSWRADTIVERQLPYRVMGCAFGRATSDTVVLLANAVGCDSAVHFSLYVWPDCRRTIDSALCEAFDGHYLLPLVWHRHRLTADSCVTDTVHRCGPHGEDSITTLCLHVLRGSTSLVAEQVVENALPHTFLGATFSADADTLFIIRNNAGCDSVIHYTLTVCRNTSAEADSQVCAATLPLRWNGAVINGDTMLAVTLANSCGADSVLRMTVVVRDSSSSTVHDTIVENQLPWTFNGRRFTGSMPDTYITIANRYGCDSVIHYSLYVHGNINIWLDSAVCAERLPLLWDGHSLAAAGTHDFRYPAVSGADSIRHYRLTVYPNYELHDTVAACDTFVWCGHTFTRSGHYLSNSYVQLSSVHGCDSLRHLHLAIGHANGGTARVDACGSYEWLGAILTQSGTYMSDQYARLLNRDGCDSVAALQLTIYRLDTVHLYDTFCQTTPYRYHDTLLHDGGLYHHQWRDRHGCDSLELLHLQMLRPAETEIEVVRLCSERSYILRRDTALGFALWSSSPSDTLLDGHASDVEVRVSPRRATVYSLYADYYDYPRCPGTAQVSLSPVEPVKARMDYSPAYLTPDRLTLTAIDRTQRTAGRHWYIDGQHYSDQVSMTYDAGVADTNVLLWLEVYTDECRDTARAIVPVMLGTLYVPNAFSPGDPTGNNRFSVFCSGVSDFHIVVYSRSGILVFESYDPAFEWDGTNHGHPCPQGSYVYSITYRDEASPDAISHRKGTVTILR